MSPFKDPEKQKKNKRKYYFEHKEESLLKSKKWRENNSEYCKEYNKQYRANNLEKLTNYQKEWREKNKQRISDERKNKYRTDNEYREKIKEKTKEVRKTDSYKKQRRRNDYERRRNDVQWKLTQTLRIRINKAIHNNQKVGSAVEDLGCSIEELKIHLENQFEEGMTWDNWKPDGWHIDHKKPLSLFDLTDREQFLEACHYTNLQPLWWEENLKKGAKYDKIDEDDELK